MADSIHTQWLFRPTTTEHYVTEDSLRPQFQVRYIIQVVPDQTIFDEDSLKEIDSYLLKNINGKNLKLSDICSEVYKFIHDSFKPKELFVEAIKVEDRSGAGIATIAKGYLTRWLKTEDATEGG